MLIWARTLGLIISIDGPAASGKSTTARLVAERLGYVYLDSGAMYRAAALRAIRLGVPMDDHDKLEDVARQARIELTDNGTGPIVLDGEDVTEAIRAPEVSRVASIMSAISGVRKALVAQQRRIGLCGDCVVEGRDIGTVVFPDAELKIYITASREERAKRRLIELGAGSSGLDLDAVMRDIEERDRRDSTRKDSPLIEPGDAIVIDTTDLGIDEQVEEVIRLAKERGATAH